MNYEYFIKMFMTVHNTRFQPVFTDLIGKSVCFVLVGATRYSGRRFFVLKCLLSKLEISPIVIARPQHVAVAISILRTVEIASLRSQ